MTNTRQKKRAANVMVERRLSALDKAQREGTDALHQAYLSALKTDIIIPKLAPVVCFEELAHTPAPERRGFKSYSENPNEAGGQS